MDYVLLMLIFFLIKYGSHGMADTKPKGTRVYFLFSERRELLSAMARPFCSSSILVHRRMKSLLTIKYKHTLSMAHSSKTLSFVPGNLRPKSPNVDENALNVKSFTRTCHTLSVVLLKLLIELMNNNSSDMNMAVCDPHFYYNRISFFY